MPRPRALNPSEAKRSLAHRFASRVDRLRQIETRLGMRPYRVVLVWSQFSGEERGEGDETVTLRREILPTPKVENMTAKERKVMSAGLHEVGSIRISEVSMLLTADMLEGREVPEPHKPIPDDAEFFYEVFEDGRGDNPAERGRYRLSSAPYRDVENLGWTFVLERRSEDYGRDAKPVDHE